MSKDASSQIQLIVVVGPTASGKSDLAVKIAQRLHGEIISADSMQLYKGMDIGTAKVTPAEMGGIPHHLIDIKEPNESFSVAEFQRLARKTIEDILRRKKIPVLVGGTGLYLNSVIDPFDFSGPEEEDGGAIREDYMQRIRSEGKEKLYQELQQIDPVSAQKLHPNDEKRIIRALEYYRLNGKPISENLQAFRKKESIYPCYLIGLNMERSQLYRRIEERVDGMMAGGLLEEVRCLLDQGCLPESQAMQGIGYRQLIQYFQGCISLEKAIDSIKQESRRYAKRQLTWFRRDSRIHWYDSIAIRETKEFEQMFEALVPHIDRHLLEGGGLLGHE